MGDFPYIEPGNPPRKPTMHDNVRAFVDYLNESNPITPNELTLRILKVGEEFGKVAQAWIGFSGQNPRKGVTHVRGDVIAELADTAFTALVAIESLGFNSRAVLEGKAEFVAERAAAGVLCPQCEKMFTNKGCAHPFHNEHCPSCNRPFNRADGPAGECDNSFHVWSGRML